MADIGFVADAHGPQVRACYDRAFRHDPAAPSGRIELSFELVESGEFGRAVQIHSELNLLGSTVVESCLIELVSEWSFPRPRPRPAGVASQRLRYPFVFTAAP
ncbi:MAG TPA: AgmX/PglI C-terminal domain-containing protein [Pseudomonadota bacterium]|nr:AgmX/PglI C-terminal domain-containing protein [Pseudomonadota bacterium]